MPKFAEKDMPSSEEKTCDIHHRTPFYQVIDGYCLPGLFPVETYRSGLAYKPRPDDLFIVTFPKCGTTWVQNIVACIYKNGEPIDSYQEYLTQTPFLYLVGAEGAESMKRPGAIKHHLPFYLAPWCPDAKYIFIARNPKDCCVSFYHHTKNLSRYSYEDGTFDDFFKLFITGQTDFGEYFDTTMSWYEHRNDPNVLFITYEELKEDTETNVLKIAEFLGNQYKEMLEKDEQLLKRVIHHSSFAFMKEHLNKLMSNGLPKEVIEKSSRIPTGIKELFARNIDVYKMNSPEGKFVRKGIVGDWRNHFSPEQNERLEKKFEKKMGNTELAEKWKNAM